MAAEDRRELKAEDQSVVSSTTAHTFCRTLFSTPVLGLQPSRLALHVGRRANPTCASVSLPGNVCRSRQKHGIGRDEQ
jgi:hypothetical protein